jgi:hypothetical protein
MAPLGRIALAHGALLDASGAGGGTVVIRGGRLLVDQSFVFADTHGARDGMRLGVDIDVAGEVAITHGSGITTDVLGGGHAGDIRIRAGSLDMRDAAFIASRPFPATTGDGGDIMVEVGRLTLRSGAQISTSTASSGRGGSVTVAASDALTLQGATPDGISPSGIFADATGTEMGAGAAGSILVTAPRVTLTDGAQIGSSTFGPGPGGSVTVMATDAVTLTGTTPDGFSSGLFSVSEGQGDAGQLTLQARTVQLADGGIIGAPSLIGGRSGAIMLEVGTLTLTGGLKSPIAASGAGAGAACKLLRERPSLSPGKTRLEGVAGSSLIRLASATLAPSPSSHGLSIWTGAPSRPARKALETLATYW